MADVFTEGKTYPLGATLSLEGTNFSVYSKHSTGIEPLLFDDPDAQPARVISINPLTNRTYHYWHVFVPGVKAGQLYGYRVETAEIELKLAIDWARSHSLVRSGEYAVLLRGQIAGEHTSRAVLAGEVPK